MPKVSTWSRKAAGLLFAVALGLLTFGPGLEGLVCGDDLGFAAAASESGAPHARLDGVEALDQTPFGHAPCVHGHCHHSLAFLTEAAADLATPLSPRPLHVIGQAPVRTSDPRTRLERPPRT